MYKMETPKMWERNNRRNREGGMEGERGGGRREEGWRERRGEGGGRREEGREGGREGVEGGRKEGRIKGEQMKRIGVEDTRRREEAFDGQIRDSLKKTGWVGGWWWGGEDPHC